MKLVFIYILLYLSQSNLISLSFIFSASAFLFFVLLRDLAGYIFRTSPVPLSEVSELELVGVGVGVGIGVSLVGRASARSCILALLICWRYKSVLNAACCCCAQIDFYQVAAANSADIWTFWCRTIITGCNGHAG